MSATPLGQRQTVQRDAVLDVIRAAPGPLTVEQIHAHARKRVARLGIATVYRTVNLLLEKSHIRAVTLPDGQTRYEAADLGHHHHFRCTRCDKVFDLEGCGVHIQDGSTLPGGYYVEDHELTLFGACPTCAKREHKTSRKSR
ncbi:MAG: transcriptional repressor [Phycisphaeraceae bacterium]|nr:transcriptional repressor [Phycisphaeraceae bacterium]